MVMPFGSFHYHIVNIYLKVSPYLVGEHIIHDSLVCGAKNLEVEGHDIIVVVVMIQHEGFFYGCL